MPKCPTCSLECKRPQDVKTHMVKVHGTKPVKKKYKKHKVQPQAQFSKLDLISILQVKISALEDVCQMLRSL